MSISRWARGTGLTQYFYEGGAALSRVILLTLAWFILVKPRFIIEAVADNNAKSFPRHSELRTQNFSPSSLVTHRHHLFCHRLAYRAAGLYHPACYQTAADARFQTVGIGGSYWLRVHQLGNRKQWNSTSFPVPGVWVSARNRAVLRRRTAMLLPYVVHLCWWECWCCWHIGAGRDHSGLVLLAGINGQYDPDRIGDLCRYVVAFPPWRCWPLSAFVHWWRCYGPDIILAAGFGNRYRHCAGSGAGDYFFGPHLRRYNEQLRQTFDSEDPVFRSAALPWGHTFISSRRLIGGRVICLASLMFWRMAYQFLSCHLPM